MARKAADDGLRPEPGLLTDSACIVTVNKIYAERTSMGRVILCMGKIANIPFLLKKPGIHVYTAEELCYCIREHTFLMDEELVCRELADWLGEDCGLPELAETLYTLLKKKASTASFLTAILEYVGFYPGEEIHRLSRFLSGERGNTELEKRKNIGDYLAGNGKYELAMEQYRRLLADVSGDDGFSAVVLHNMGFVCGRLFLFERAAELFYQAWQLSGETESLVQFLAAKRLLLDEKAYVDFIAGQQETYYEASMELEKRVELAAGVWDESSGAKLLEDVRWGLRENPADAGHIWEDVAEQQKEACRNMIRET